MGSFAMTDIRDTESQNKLRKHFDDFPYPETPIEQTHQNDSNFLYNHNLVTSYYLRNQKVLQTEGKVILDAGCGSGFKALGLAEANPGAKIIGVDISPESIKLAQQRLQYHGFETAEFHVLSIDDLAQLNQPFDYINCDEVLYLLDNPVSGLQAMQSVLKKDGILRVNLHSAYNRAHIFRMQNAFKMMGLMEDIPRDFAVEAVRETIKALRDDVLFKKFVGMVHLQTFEQSREAIGANFLLVGDKGYTIPELFAYLRAAHLEFISMVQWRSWDVMDLFKDSEDLPLFLALAFQDATKEERLHLYELIHPNHRLLDIWCGHPQSEVNVTPISDCARSNWQGATVHIHPQLNTPIFRMDLNNCLKQIQPFEISQYLHFGQSSMIDCSIAACLFPPLLESPQPMSSLIKRWQTLHPVNPTTLEPVQEEELWGKLGQAILGLEASGYILLDRE